MVKPELDATVDYYKVLSLPRSCSQVDIRRAYLDLARTQHPDKNPGRETEYAVRFQRITVAYEVLKDPASKRTYDGVRKPSPAKPKPQPQSAYQANYTSAQAARAQAQKQKQQQQQRRPASPSKSWVPPWQSGGKPAPRSARPTAGASTTAGSAPPPKFTTKPAQSPSPQVPRDTRPAVPPPFSAQTRPAPTAKKTSQAQAQPQPQASSHADGRARGQPATPASASSPRKEAGYKGRATPDTYDWARSNGAYEAAPRVSLRDRRGETFRPHAKARPVLSSDSSADNSSSSADDEDDDAHFLDSDSERELGDRRQKEDRKRRQATARAAAASAASASAPKSAARSADAKTEPGAAAEGSSPGYMQGRRLATPHSRFRRAFDGEWRTPPSPQQAGSPSSFAASSPAKPADTPSSQQPHASTAAPQSTPPADTPSQRTPFSFKLPDSFRSSPLSAASTPASGARHAAAGVHASGGGGVGSERPRTSFVDSVDLNFSSSTSTSKSRSSNGRGSTGAGIGESVGGSVGRSSASRGSRATTADGLPSSSPLRQAGDAPQAQARPFVFGAAAAATRTALWEDSDDEDEDADERDDDKKEQKEQADEEDESDESDNNDDDEKYTTYTNKHHKETSGRPAAAAAVAGTAAGTAAGAKSRDELEPPPIPPALQTDPSPPISPSDTADPGADDGADAWLQRYHSAARAFDTYVTAWRQYEAVVVVKLTISPTAAYDGGTGDEHGQGRGRGRGQGKRTRHGLPPRASTAGQADLAKAATAAVAAAKDYDLALERHAAALRRMAQWADFRRAVLLRQL